MTIEASEPIANLPSKLDLGTQARETRWNTWDKDPNIPDSKLGIAVQATINVLNGSDIQAIATSDVAIQALRVQTLNHLKHVSFGFNVREGSEDYTHKPVIAGPYPSRPTIVALEKGVEFMDILHPISQETTPFKPFDHEKADKLRAEQADITAAIFEDPLRGYKKLKDRLEKEGPNASFPEFSSTVQYLQEYLLGDENVRKFTENNPSMGRFRELVLARLNSVTERNSGNHLPYTQTILAIERAMEFFDVLQRANLGESAPDLYHSGRYEYYFHFLIAQKDHVLFPTISNFGIKDLIKARGVPIGFAGVNVENQRVDGFLQTPTEFFFHDINHSRRMFQFFTETAFREEMSIEDFAQHSTEFIENVIMPAIVAMPEDSLEEREKKSAMEMVVFEILHEDALAATPEVISNAIVRPPLQRTPFEFIDNNGDVVYIMEEGATTLAYVFRKFAHTFYDTPEKRSEDLGGDVARSREGIVNAAVELMNIINPSYLPPEQLIRFLEQLVVTDEGFPDAFFQEVIADMNKRRKGSEGDFTFFVSKPKNADEVIEELRTSGKKIHSIFGYSDLGYEDEEVVMDKVRSDLSQLDPSTTAIAIGATRGGIGKAYEIAKSLGFTTVGIVSSKSLAHGGHYSDYVDEINIVRDTEWGGYLPGTNIMAPTTQVFVQASDSIAAYGGGMNTAVAIKEAMDLGKSVTFTPAEMNHTLVGDNTDYKGLAQKAWDEINS